MSPRKTGGTVPKVRRCPICEYCKKRMLWFELLRTWGCRGCGYFLEHVCAHCGAIYEPPVPSCPECNGRTPDAHKVMT